MRTKSEHYRTKRIEAFDKISEYWDERPLPDGFAEKAKKIVQSANIQPGETVIDIGSGTGGLISALMQTPAAGILAVDYSPKMLKKLSEKFFCEKRLHTLRSDAHNLPFEDNLCGSIICHGVIPHFRDIPAAFKEIVRVVKPGGRVVIAHSIGRDKVNYIHSTHQFEVLREDLLPGADQISDILKSTNCKILEVIDTENLYLLTAERM